MKRLQLVLAVAGLLATFLLVVSQWWSMPPIIPIHFGADGRANGYGSRVWMWFPAVMAVSLFAFLGALGRAPQRYNLPVPPGDARRGPYEGLAAEMIGWLRVTLVWMFFGIAVLETQGARGRGGPAVLWLLPAVLGGSFLPVAWFFWRARSLRA